MNQLARLAVLFSVFMALLVPASYAATSKTSKSPVTKVAKKTAVNQRVKSKRPVGIGSRKKVVYAPSVAPKQSYGEIAGLHQKSDALDLKKKGMRIEWWEKYI